MAVQVDALVGDDLGLAIAQLDRDALDDAAPRARDGSTSSPRIDDGHGHAPAGGPLERPGAVDGVEPRRPAEARQVSP